mmetsp:Transcript_56247/g.89573  ORF Transcript_56247/g.89573 Transcript_56247/m.89573 type:complete len:206 (-) Transcript_56247:101-718(-)
MRVERAKHAELHYDAVLRREVERHRLVYCRRSGAVKRGHHRIEQQLAIQAVVKHLFAVDRVAVKRDAFPQQAAPIGNLAVSDFHPLHLLLVRRQISTSFLELSLQIVHVGVEHQRDDVLSRDRLVWFDVADYIQVALLARHHTESSIRRQEDVCFHRHRVVIKRAHGIQRIVQYLLLQIGVLLLHEIHVALELIVILELNAKAIR